MSHRLVSLLLLLFCTATVAVGQQWKSGEGDWSDEGWQGDLGIFWEEKGLLRYRDDGKAGSAVLFKTYTRGLSDLLYWETQTRFEAVPTASNHFIWTLFFEKQGESLYAYCIEPEPRGTGVAITQYKANSAYTGYTDRRVLESLRLDNPALAWSSLILQALFTVEDGLRMTVILPDGRAMSTLFIILRGGEFIPRMALHTRFSAQKKLSYAWMLPTVSTTLGTGSTDLRYTGIEVFDEGRIVIRLDRPVRIDQAEATVSGTPVSISMGQTSSEIILTLPFAFTGGTRYPVSISRLIDLKGTAHDLAFDIGAESDKPDDPTPEASGIFITEVMASPPESGPLNGAKYIELYNNTSETIPLQALQLHYKGQRFRLPATPLAPYSYALLYPLGSNPSDLGVQVPMLEFPALSGSFFLSLEEVSTGAALDRIHFSPALYGEGVPAGGASVERVVFRPPEWRRSDSPTGGTPGRPTAMKAHQAVEKGTVVINELMLSPEPTGEKYIELLNTSDSPVELSDLYLAYKNSPTASPKSWLLVTAPRTIPAGGYTVLCPYPEALPRLHDHTDRETYVERIDFPPLSPTYTEVALMSHKGHTPIDNAIYRRQWLGDTSADRSHHSLERISPGKDGTRRSAWSRSSVGGTPGVRNQPLNTAPTPDAEWPDDPHLSLDDLIRLAPLYSDRLTLELFHLSGSPFLRADKKDAEKLLHELMQNSAPLPTTIYIIRATITPTEEGLQPLTYTSKWLHTPAL